MSVGVKSRGALSRRPRPAARAGRRGAPAGTVPPVAPQTGAGGGGWSWSRSRDVVLTLLGAAGLLYLTGWALGSLVGTLLAAVLAALLAFLLRPLVALLQRRTPLGRGAAAAVVYLGVLVLVVGVGAWMVAQVAAQATAAVTALPMTIQTLRERLPEVEERASAVGLSLNVAALQETLRDSLRTAGLASEGLTLGAAWIAALGEGLLNVVLVLVLSFYFVLDGERLLVALLTLAPARAKPYLLFAEKSLAQVVGGYARGQLTVAAIIGGTVFLVCLVLGVPYSLVLGVLAFCFEWVPYVGPTLIGVVMTGVALTQSVWLAGAVLAFYVALQALESHILAPRITGRAVGLHPVAALLAFVVGARLFGLWGLLFAVPLLAFVSVIVSALYHQLRGLPVVAGVPR